MGKTTLPSSLSHTYRTISVFSGEIRLIIFGPEFADRLEEEHPDFFPANLSDGDRAFIRTCSSSEHPARAYTIKAGQMVVYQAYLPHTWTITACNTMTTNGRVLTYDTLDYILEDSLDIAYMQEEDMAQIYVAYVMHALYKTVSAFEMEMLRKMPPRKDVLRIVQVMDRLINLCEVLFLNFEKIVDDIWDGRLQLKVVRDIIEEYL